MLFLRSSLPSRPRIQTRNLMGRVGMAVCALAFVGAACLPAPAMAQAAKAFTVTAYAVDSQTLTGNRMTIALWGVDAPVTQGTDAMRARAALDDLLGGRPIRCLVMGGDTASGNVRARCLNAAEKDIGLAMITDGLLVADRREVAESELSATYLGAERQARAGNAGLWSTTGAPAPVVEAAAPAPSASPFGAMPSWIMLAALIGVPMIGFFLMAMILQLNFRQLIKLQKYQIAGTQKREKQLKEREKYVIASALEGELMTNRAKLDAFLVIYEELLKSLRDQGRTPKYQRAGDIIHEKPALSRTVYDAHIDKLDLLGPQLSSELASLYAMVVPNPDYKTLEPEVPIEKARELVDRIVRNAERLMEPMDKVVGALAVIVRDKRGSITSSE